MSLVKTASCDILVSHRCSSIHVKEQTNREMFHVISYAKLWKLLARRSLQPKALCSITGISTSTLRAMQKNQHVRMDVLERICEALHVDIGDVCSFFDKAI